MSPLIVIPAAGASKRMRGGDKLMETIEGIPLLRRQALAAMTTGCPVAVTLPSFSHPRREALQDLPLILEEVPDAKEGMAASLRHGANLLAQDQSMGILLPDVPGITSSDITHVLRAFRDRDEKHPVRGGDETTNTPGTPVFFPHHMANTFTTLQGTETGKKILNAAEPQYVLFPDDRATRDLDTPEDWVTWRAETNTPW